MTRFSSPILLLALWFPLAPFHTLTHTSSSDQVQERAGKAAFKAVLKEVLVLGDDEDKPIEYLFGELASLATDSEGNIYVADRLAMDIRVFDERGVYLRSMGERGEAPGEFKDLTTITVDAEDHLIVVDHLNARITRFSPQGEVLSTHRTSYSVRPRQVREGASGNYILVYKLPDLIRNENELVSGPDANYLFHVYDRVFNEKVSMFGSFLDTWPEGHFSGKIAEFVPGYFDVTAKGDIIYAPALYSGALYYYHKEPHGWRMTKKLDGHVEKKNAYTPIDYRYSVGQ